MIVARHQPGKTNSVTNREIISGQTSLPFNIKIPIIKNSITKVISVVMEKTVTRNVNYRRFLVVLLLKNSYFHIFYIILIFSEE